MHYKEPGLRSGLLCRILALEICSIVKFGSQPSSCRSKYNFFCESRVKYPNFPVAIAGQEEVEQGEGSRQESCCCLGRCWQHHPAQQSSQARWATPSSLSCCKTTHQLFIATVISWVLACHDTMLVSDVCSPAAAVTCMCSWQSLCHFLPSFLLSSSQSCSM